MAQLVSSFFNLGQPRAIADPRESEQREREASQRAERALRSQISQQAMANAQAMRQEQLQVAALQNDQRRINEQSRQFDAGLGFQREQMANQNQQYEALRGHEAQQAALGRDFQAQQSDFARALQMEMARMSGDQAGIDRDLRARLANQQMGYQQQRDVVGDQRFAEELRLRMQAMAADRDQSAASLALQRDKLGEERRQFDTVQALQEQMRRAQAEAQARQTANELFSPYANQIFETGQFSDADRRKLEFAGSVYGPEIDARLKEIMKSAALQEAVAPILPGDPRSSAARDAYMGLSSIPRAFLYAFGLADSPLDAATQSQRELRRASGR